MAGATLALGNGLTQPSVAAYVSKRAGDSEQGGVLGVDHYGASAPFKVIAEHFGFTPANVVKVAKELLQG